jgi:histone deacetylase 11
LEAYKERPGGGIKKLCIKPEGPISEESLRTVHSSRYLKQLTNSEYVAGALEIPPMRYLPASLLDYLVLRAMRYACQGSVMTARAALTHGFAVNLGGGYHHAKAEAGEGFCIYSDIALAVQALRLEKQIQERQRVVYIDLDAHQGNGVSHIFYDDPRLFMFDIYNSGIYPASDRRARQRIDCDLGIYGGCGDDQYLETLTGQLPGFLDSTQESEEVALAIYNAGTDIFEEDQLGGFSVSAEAILERDLFVIEQCRRREIPLMMLLSGGYSSKSYQLVADSLITVFRDQLQTGDLSSRKK